MFMPTPSDNSFIKTVRIYTSLSDLRTEPANTPFKGPSDTSAVPIAKLRGVGVTRALGGVFLLVVPRS